MPLAVVLFVAVAVVLTGCNPTPIQARIELSPGARILLGKTLYRNPSRHSALVLYRDGTVDPSSGELTLWPRQRQIGPAIEPYETVLILSSNDSRSPMRVSHAAADTWHRMATTTVTWQETQSGAEGYFIQKGTVVGSFEVFQKAGRTQVR